MIAQLQGADRTYAFDLTRTNAVCQLEEATGLPYPAILKALACKRPRVGLLREFVRCALVDPPDVSLEEAGTILDDIGGAGVVREAVKAAKTPARRRG